jgi:ActR/RegA family two-component response regulator
MIKGINAGGRYMTIVGGATSSNYINNYSGAQGVGNMRFNTSTQNVEIYDGNNWQTMSTSYATVQLNSEAEALLDWAREQRSKQWEREALAKTHPAVAAAVEAVKRAEEQLEVITILSKEHEKNEQPAS